MRFGSTTKVLAKCAANVLQNLRSCSPASVALLATLNLDWTVHAWPSVALSILCMQITKEEGALSLPTFQQVMYASWFNMPLYYYIKLLADPPFPQVSSASDVEYLFQGSSLR